MRLLKSPARAKEKIEIRVIMTSIPVPFGFRLEENLRIRKAIGQGWPHATGIITIDLPGHPGQIQTEPPGGESFVKHFSDPLRFSYEGSSLLRYQAPSCLHVFGSSFFGYGH
jgi:hypothetical protein